MYWTMLVNVSANGVIEYDKFDTRFGDEAKFRFPMGLKQVGLIKIVVYDVKALWYKNMDRGTGDYQGRCDDDVIQEIRDHLFYCGHDVISCQLDRGVP